MLTVTPVPRKSATTSAHCENIGLRRLVVRPGECTETALIFETFHAGGGTRTPKGFRPPAPKAGAFSVSPRPRKLLRGTREDCMFPPTMAGEERGYRIERPNRAKPASKATKAVVLMLLLISAGLVLIVTVGGWARLAGAQTVQLFYIAVYLVMAFYVARWNRGVLPLAAALAMILGIFASIAGPAWFDRDKTGFDDPLMPHSLLGLITLLIVPVQVLLIAFGMRAFQQEWNVEVEVPEGETYSAERHQPRTA